MVRRFGNNLLKMALPPEATSFSRRQSPPLDFSSLASRLSPFVSRLSPLGSRLSPLASRLLKQSAVTVDFKLNIRKRLSLNQGIISQIAYFARFKIDFNFISGFKI